MNQKYLVESAAGIDFLNYFSTAKKEVENELKKFLSTLTRLDLYPKIEYALMSEGKRFRPVLAILAAESVGGERSKVMPLALAFELIHNATLVHDDIIDHDEFRRNRPSLYKKWSVNEAILTGDALIALSISLASSYGADIIDTVARSALELCEGERMDLVGSLKTITEEAYFKRIKDKSASLCRAAAYCGGKAGGGLSAEINALSKFGENFGVAYQLRDDVLDFASGDPTLKDLVDKKITLPLIHCYNNSTKEEKKRIENLQSLISENPSSAIEKIDELMQLIDEKGSIEYCEKKIDNYLSNAMAAIDVLKDTDYKRHLIEMIKALTKME